jgi:spoIIIJ-associated protein
LRRVLVAAGLRVTFEVLDGAEVEGYFEGPSVVVRFQGHDLEYLLANKGEALLALEQLSQEVLAMAPDEHALICFDGNDFRLLRQEELRISALTIAERVRESRTPYRFNPMSSRERRILHLALREETDLRSESSGTGAYRHVVVYLHDMPSLPEPPAPPPGFRRPSSRPPERGPRGDRDGRGDRGDRGNRRGRPRR